MSMLTYTPVVAAPAKKHRLQSRITDACRALIDALMENYGISEAAVVEQAVREYAEKRGIKPNPLQSPAVAVAEQRAEYRAGE